MTNLKVLRNDVEWETRFDGDISSIEVNGQKLNDIHDISLKIENLGIQIRKTLKVSLVLASVCCVLATGIACWLLVHHKTIKIALTP